MAQHAHVPKFGNWEGDGDVPYTQYFDNARKGKSGGKLINPNDPQQNPSSFPEGVPAVRASPLRNESGLEIPKPTSDDAVGRKTGTDAFDQRHEWVNASDHRRTDRMNGGSDRSIERSPLHPHHQVKSAASKGGVSSPSWERKGSSEAGHGFAPGPSTPGRSKLRPGGRGDQTDDKGSTVPKFGDWDESNPSSADGYTHIFNKVREEKQVGSAKVPIIKTDPVYDTSQGQKGSNFDSSSCSCFGWCRRR